MAVTFPLNGMFGPLVMETVAVKLSGQRETFQEWPGLVMEQMVMVDRPIMVKLWYGVGRWDVMTYNILHEDVFN